MERQDRAPVGTFFAPGPWAGVVDLEAPAAHHAQVKRLVPGDIVRLTNGRGRRVTGTLMAAGNRRLAVEIDTDHVEGVAPPPPVTLMAPVGDRDRMLLLAEKSVELGLSGWQPVVFERSRSVNPRGEGEAFREKVRRRMIAALEQSGGAWLPDVAPECTVSEVCARASTSSALLLTQHAPPLTHALGSIVAPCALAVGPEGGYTAGELDAFAGAGWRAASLGDNVLRFETAGIVALALVRAHLR